MLTGTIAVGITPTGTLWAIATPQSDEIDVQITAAGHVTLEADANFRFLQSVVPNSLTIPDVQNLVIRLGAGHDRLTIRGGSSPAELSSVKVFAAGGNDQIDLSNLQVAQSVVVRGQTGADTIRILDHESSLGDRTRLFGGVGEDQATSPAGAYHVGFRRFSELLELDPFDAESNTEKIHSVVHHGGTAAIPAGSWPVRPISIKSQGGIVGLGEGISELRLDLDESPGRYDPQHVISTDIPAVTDGFVSDVYVTDLTINGDYQSVDWSNVYGDGNGFGIYVRAADQSHFKNLEIKNTWTDGIYVSNILHQDNNTRRTHFENITIYDAGRQGVSVVGGEQLVFDNFRVSSIGRGDSLHTSPRSAIDLEPESNVQRLVRDITISNWNIHHVGQGILVSGGHSAEQARNVRIENIAMYDLDGPQILAIRDTHDVFVKNISSVGHVTTAGLGVFFQDATGEVEDVTLRYSSGSNYLVHVTGDSDLNIRRLLIDRTERGAIHIGGEPGDSQNTNVRFVDFDIRNLGNAGLSVIRVNSRGHVKFANGSISGSSAAPYTLRLYTDILCSACHFVASRYGLFAPEVDGIAIGDSNSWN